MKPLLTLFCTVLLHGLFATRADAQVMPQHCTTDPRVVDVLLVDVSEVYDNTDRQRFAQGMDRYFSKLVAGGVLDIYTIDGDASSFGTVFSSCVPGCAEELDAGESNWTKVCFTVRTQRDKQIFRNEFVRVMRALVANSASAEGSETLATLEQLNRQYGQGQARVRSVTIFSDMIEYSRYNRAVNYFDPEKAQALLRKAQAELGDIRILQQAEVFVFGMGKRLGQQHLIATKGAGEAKLPDVADRAFEAFWRDFFTGVLGVPNDKLTLTLDYK